MHGKLDRVGEGGRCGIFEAALPNLALATEKNHGEP
jgi:hypothetical protein